MVLETYFETTYEVCKMVQIINETKASIRSRPLDQYKLKRRLWDVFVSEFGRPPSTRIWAEIQCCIIRFLKSDLERYWDQKLKSEKEMHTEEKKAEVTKHIPMNISLACSLASAQRRHRSKQEIKKCRQENQDI